MGTLNKKIYILHGWTYSFDKWLNFENSLKENDFEPKLLKIPGLTEKSDKIWDLDKYSDWLYKHLATEKGKVILLGHSNGGRIASYFSAKYPNKIQKLILVDIAGIYHNELPIRIKRYVFKFLSSIGKKITSLEVLRKVLYKLARESDYEKSDPNTRQTMINLISKDLTQIFSIIKIPTLIIWGGDDKVTPIADGLTISKLIKGSKLKIIKGAKHSPFFTHTKEVLDIIKNDF